MRVAAAQARSCRLDPHATTTMVLPWLESTGGAAVEHAAKKSA